MQRLFRLAAVTCLCCLMPTAASLADEIEHSDGLRDRAHLFGDWRGARTSLAERGIIVNVSTKQFYQGITSGGKPEARSEWEYSGVGDAYVTIVGDKFGLDEFCRPNSHAFRSKHAITDTLRYHCAQLFIP